MLTTASFFAGVGGIDQGFADAGFDIIWANEIDKYAAKTFKLNFDTNLVVEDINKIDAADIPDFDVMIAGFPCQAFSVAGYRKGFDDDRGNLFFQLLRIIKAKNPKAIFLENVKNLIGHDNGNTYKVIKSSLENAGYLVTEKVLNACEYGNIPQNRERIYIVAFNDQEAYDSFEFPEPIELTTKLKDIIDYSHKKSDIYYYNKDKCIFYDKLEETIKKQDTLYQWRRIYVRENKSNLCPTLTANMGTGGHNVPLVLTNKGIRKLTPHECFSFQGFHKDFKLPKDMANCHLYKQAGNSVCVTVIKRIAENMLKAINNKQ